MNTPMIELTMGICPDHPELNARYEGESMWVNVYKVRVISSHSDHCHLSVDEDLDFIVQENKDQIRLEMRDAGWLTGPLNHN